MNNKEDLIIGLLQELNKNILKLSEGQVILGTIEETQEIPKKETRSNKKQIVTKKEPLFGSGLNEFEKDPAFKNFQKDSKIDKKLSISTREVGNKKPVEKIGVECVACNKSHNVYPSQLINGKFKCNKCCVSGKISEKELDDND